MARHVVHRYAAATDAVPRVGSCRSGSRFGHRNPRVLDAASTSVKTPLRFHCLSGASTEADATGRPVRAYGECVEVD
ncbi:hypothetical protein C7S13_5441 [Burkholderia cepacia]|nr:hypothetical protein [Burkholderia cepacia]